MNKPQRLWYLALLVPVAVALFLLFGGSSADTTAVPS